MSKKTDQTKVKQTEYIFAVGRRREAVARVRLYQGKGQILVNEVPIDQYFPGLTNQALYLEPFRVTNTVGQFYATIKVNGGGKSGQLGAVIHGLARALAKKDLKNFRPILKKRGFLTRDARVKERRKYGHAQKARAKKQSPKR